VSAAGPGLCLLKNLVGLLDYYRMRSEAISVSTAQLRSAAAVHDGYAADLAAYRADCQNWIAGIRADILRCHGTVADPVGAALAEFAATIGGHSHVASAHHGAMGAKLVAAAAGYEATDEAGAAIVRGVGV